MKAVALAVLLVALPVTAQTPTVDQLLGEYNRMPWLKVDATDQEGETHHLACVPLRMAPRLDRLFDDMAKRAKGLTCS